MANFSNYEYGKDGLVTFCEIDGISAVYINPFWSKEHFQDVLSGASALGFIGHKLDEIFAPDADYKGGTLGALAGVLLVTSIQYNVKKEGYYERDSSGKATSNILFEGKVYYRNGKLEKG